MTTMRLQDIIDSFNGEDGVPKYPIFHIRNGPQVGIAVPKADEKERGKWTIGYIPYGNKTIERWAEEHDLDYQEAVRELFTMNAMSTLGVEREIAILTAFNVIIFEWILLSSKDKYVRAILDNIEASGSELASYVEMYKQLTTLPLNLKEENTQ